MGGNRRRRLQPAPTALAASLWRRAHYAIAGQWRRGAKCGGRSPQLARAATDSTLGDRMAAYGWLTVRSIRCRRGKKSSLKPSYLAIGKYMLADDD